MSSLNPERYIVKEGPRGRKGTLLRKVHEEGRKILFEETPGNLSAISPEWWEQAVPQ